VVPDATPVTTPPFVIVATPGVPDVHGVAALGVADPSKVIVLVAQTVNPPVIVGFELTVTIAVVVQPFVFSYVISDVPAATPVTTPPLVMVATPGVPDIHGVAALGVAVPNNVTLLATHTVNVPVIAGFALTVTIAVVVQPFVFS